MTTKDPTTIKAVLAFAQTLRQRGGTQRAADCWAKPYEPSEAVARKLCAQHGPDDALAVLAGRAATAQREYREDQETSKRSLERHQRRQQKATQERDKQRRALTPGQRIDKALAEFSVVPAAGAAQVGRSTKSSDRPSVKNHGDPSGEARYVAVKAAREVESLLDRHRLRDVGKAA